MELREVIAQVERALEEPLAPRAPSSQPLVPVSQPSPADEEGLEEAGAIHDPADASLALRLARVVGVHALRWVHMSIEQALDVVERLARRAGARLPERDLPTAGSHAPVLPVVRPDPTTRPATGRERWTVARWYASGDSRAAREEPADARPAETDEFELPRLIDLTRRFDRFPDRPSDRFAQSDATLQPHESSPGSRGRPASEKPDDDKNWWRLP